MLGIFYLLFNTIGLTGGYIKDGISNANAKDYAQKLYDEGKNRAHTYLDTQGNDRDLTTNHKVVTYRDKNRDLIVKDLKTGKEKNIDKPAREAKYRQEEREALRKAKGNGGIASFGAFMEKEYRKTFLFCKDRYIDIHGNIYIKKYLIWNSKTMGLSESDRIGVFYMNIKTNEIDYFEITDSGKVFKHCTTCDFPYRSYDMLYANEEESEKYKEWFNKNISKTKEEPLKFCGKFSTLDYKRP